MPAREPASHAQKFSWRACDGFIGRVLSIAILWNNLNDAVSTPDSDATTFETGRAYLFD